MKEELSTVVSSVGAVSMLCESVQMVAASSIVGSVFSDSGIAVLLSLIGSGSIGTIPKSSAMVGSYGVSTTSVVFHFIIDKKLDLGLLVELVDMLNGVLPTEQIEIVSSDNPPTGNGSGVRGGVGGNPDGQGCMK